MTYLVVSHLECKNTFVTQMLFITGLAVAIFATFYGSDASANPAQPFYGAPYYDNDEYVNDGHSQTVDEQVQRNWHAYQKYWGVSPYGKLSCGYTFTPTANGPSAGNFGHIIYTGQCAGGNSVFGTLQCRPGYKLVGNTCAGAKELAITPSSSFIPVGSGVENGHVLTMSYLDLLVTQNDEPVAGVSVPLQSDRGKKDQIDNNTVTNSDGAALAFISTRNQPGTSAITSATADIETSEPGVINWLPAEYEASFELTCYGVAQETLDTKGPLVTMRGLPGKYHTSFVSDIREQGTGVLLNGQFIQKHHGEYIPVTCPLTSSGLCAIAGETVAVDLKVIPMVPSKGIHSHIDISGVGERMAEDTGGKIGNYHIDVFYGRTADDYTACLDQFGKTFGHTVTLLNYGN